MNNLEKIQEIKRIFMNYDQKECPYCGFSLETFINKEGTEQEYCGKHEGDYIVELIDYFNEIKEIVEHSNIKQNPTKYKKIIDF